MRQLHIKAIEIKPDYAIAYYNLGNILNELNKPIDASIAYRKAIEIKPDSAEAYNKLGAVLEYQDNPADAIDLYIKAINKKPDYIDPYINLGNVLNGVTFKKARPDLEPVILSLLNKNTAVNPRDICKSTLSALKHRKELNKYLSIESLSSEFFRSNQIIKDLVGIPLLLKLMGICPLPDIELENLLVFLRSTLLLSKDSIEFTKDLLKFQSALALQCFTNEYIYHTTNEEKKALLELEDEVIQILSTNQQPSSSSILCLTSYKPLYDYSWATSLIANDEIMDIYIQQFQEPELETQIKSNLPKLKKVSNSTSLKVRDQYEANPYPRWVNLKLENKAESISNIIKVRNLKLASNAIKKVNSPKILVAGCGTGQHSINVSSRFPDAKILAVDLSLASLSYAERKTRELGIQNIQYMQADILDLRDLCRKFDIIESIGVLHHMADPKIGWQTLTDCLEPWGLMKIGLYSEIARQHIVQMRKETTQREVSSTGSEMQRYRNLVIQSGEKHHKKVTDWADFYSLSELRDLLFHVKEHRFTIPQIKQYLSDLKLTLWI